MPILPLSDTNLYDNSGLSDSSDVVSKARAAIMLTYRLYCKRHAPETSPSQADSMANEAFDTIIRRERHNMASLSKVGLENITEKVINKLGVKADRELASDLGAHLTLLASDLPHHLTMV